MQMLFTMALQSAGDRVNTAAPIEDVIGQLNELRLAEVDRECEEMWAIFVECADKLIDRKRLLPSATPPQRMGRHLTEP